MFEKQREKKKALFIVIFVAYVIVLIIVGKAWAERFIVKRSAETYMQTIKTGLDDNTVNEVVDNIISIAAGDEFLGALLQNNINGKDINDIYQVFMKKMSYRVTGVEKLQSGGYRVGIEIKNNNNIMVIKKAIDLYKEKYEGDLLDKVSQFWEDINSDKSQLIASLISEAAEILEANQGAQLVFSQDYVISLDSDGNIFFENENGSLSFILACAGIDYSAGESPEIQDEYKLYSGLLVILVIIGIVSVVFYIRGKSKTQIDTSTFAEGSAPEDNTSSKQSIPSNYEENQQPVMSKAGIPMLYAQSAQHNNMPFAVHATPILIGRDRSTCKVVFNEGTAGVSSRHCSISYDSSLGQFVLVDLRSTYGTFLMNGEKLTENKQYYLKPGDCFFVGDKANSFMVEIGEI